MELSKTSIEKIREAGLHIDNEPDFGENHSAYPNGYTVLKPKAVGGNSIPDFEPETIIRGDMKLTVDAPRIVIYPKAQLWHVVHEWTPGAGAGDFDLGFETEA